MGLCHSSPVHPKSEDEAIIARARATASATLAAAQVTLRATAPSAISVSETICRGCREKGHAKGVCPTADPLRKDGGGGRGWNQKGGNGWNENSGNGKGGSMDA